MFPLPMCASLEGNVSPKSKVHDGTSCFLQTSRCHCLYWHHAAGPEKNNCRSGFKKRFGAVMLSPGIHSVKSCVPLKFSQHDLAVMQCAYTSRGKSWMWTCPIALKRNLMLGLLKNSGLSVSGIDIKLTSGPIIKDYWTSET